LDGLDPVARKNIDDHVAPIWWGPNNPSKDFVMGKVYQFVLQLVNGRLEDSKGFGSGGSFLERKEYLYGQKNAN